MSDDTIAEFVAEHPKMAGALFTTMLLQSRTRAVPTRNTAYAGP